MNTVLKWSVILAVLVAALTVVMALTGLNTSPITALVAIAVAILINLTVVFLALKQTAAENSYGKQLLNGVLIGLVGGVLIFFASWAMLAVVFPDYLDQTREGYTAWFDSMGLPEEQFESQVQRLDEMTPLNQSVPGFFGTFGTSLVGAAIIGIFLRRK